MRVLGSECFFLAYSLDLTEAMAIADFPRFLRTPALWFVLAFLFLSATSPSALRAQAVAKPAPSSQAKPVLPGAGGGDQNASLEADQQRQVGRIYYADGHVDLLYDNTRLRADHVEYNEDTQVAKASGHVQLDYETQHVEADDAVYELKTGKGTFHHVRASFAIQRRASPTLLISPNPIYFEAEETERIDQNTYKIHKAWMTVCDPAKPTWKFYAPEATVYMQKSVHLENGNFRLFSIPVLYLPYATFPAEKERTSGFMIPDVGQSSTKGFILGDAVYWAPTDWMDLTLGANYYSKRGWAEKGDLRMRPWENAKLDVLYSGMIDRGLVEAIPPTTPGGPTTYENINQGGHEVHALFTALLPDDWRAVADLDQLSSLTYRIAWSETFAQAVNSEVPRNAFLSKNFRGFSLNFASLSYQNYFTATTTASTSDTSVTLRAAPEVEASSVDQAPWTKLPIYFSFEGFSDAVHRNDTVTGFSTPSFVERSEIAPTVTIPLHFGPWLDVTPSFTLRTTLFGGQLGPTGDYVGKGFWRTTEEFSLDLRPFTLDKVWTRGDTKWKHVIEPDVVYSYVNGVDNFGKYIRFDEDETLTDTNEVQYGITQRLYRRDGDGSADEVASLSVTQKYFFDPTFGGALVSGERNVFATLDALTPFAFADEPRRFSPIVANLRIEPGKHFDTEVILNFDPYHNRLQAIGTLVKWKPYKESFITLAHFSVQNLPSPADQEPPDFVFENRSNQIRALVGYGDLTRHGLNATFGASYDITQAAFQNQIAEVSYNGDCCGLGFEYRRFSFGTIRNENQYLIVFRIANLGSAGTLRRAEKIF
jgi:LPS-assembly protein